MKTQGFESLETVFTTSINGFAIGQAAGLFYIVGDQLFTPPDHVDSGGLVEEFEEAGNFEGQFGPSLGASFEPENLVAVDNSGGPFAGDVYVLSHGDRELWRFKATGEPLPFGCASVGCGKYISGNEIIGTEAFVLPGGSDVGLAVDGSAGASRGDVYAATTDYEGEPAAVLAYAPSGEFLHAVVGAGVPLPPEAAPAIGFGGTIEGLAVDPSNGDLLVSLLYPTDTGGEAGAVDEFNSAGRFLGQIGQAEGKPLAGAFALAVDSKGDVYVANHPRNVSGEVVGVVDRYGPGGFVPGLRVGAAPHTSVSGVLTGAVNPESLSTPNPAEYGVSDCHFEYTTETEFSEKAFSGLGVQKVPCEEPAAAGIPKNEEFTGVHAKTGVLTSGVTYRYRLSGTLSGLLGGLAAQTQALAFTAAHAPVVSGAAANGITSAFADVTARVDPLGADSSYHFEYVTQQQFEASGFAGAVVTPSVDVGPGGPDGDAQEGVLAHLSGLTPGTAYRFRVLAENEVGASPVEEAVFTTQPSVTPGLPDGRAYELLTPADKQGAEDMFGFGFGEEDQEEGEVSLSGDEFLLDTRAEFGPAPASVNNVYVFSRHAGVGGPEWSYTQLANSAGVQSIRNVAASEAVSFSRVAFADEEGDINSEAGTTNTLLVGAPGGPYVTLHSDQAQHVGEKGKKEESQVVGASADVGRVLIESTSHTLAPEAVGLDEGAPGLYECASSGEGCVLVAAKSDGALVNKCGAVPGAGASLGAAYQAVSRDGSQVIFTAPERGGFEHVLTGAGCAEPAQLYVRSGGEVVEVSAPQAGGEAGVHYPAVFVGASSDGSRVFFTSEGWLTASHPAVHDKELYEYQPQTGALARVSNAGAAGADVLTVPAVASGGQAVYYSAFAALAPGAEQHPPVAIKAGAPVNLYRYEPVSAATTFVATIDAGDDPENADCLLSARPCPNRDYYATPDGRFLLFASHAQLTPEVHNAASSCNYVHNEGETFFTCTELYRFDSESGSLLCVSCNPSGVVPTANAVVTGSEVTPAAAVGPSRAMSDDGGFVFFDTAEGLVPQDTNGAIDVYEWHEGHIYLLSSGKDRSPSFFLGASADGRNVFIGTHAKLVPGDTGEEGNLYDARICTSSEPCVQPPAVRAGLCEADACSHPPAALSDPVQSLVSPLPAGAGSPGSAPPAPTAAQVRARALAKALRTCRRVRHAGQRRACERRARRRFGVAARVRKLAKRVGG